MAVIQHPSIEGAPAWVVEDDGGAHRLGFGRPIAYQDVPQELLGAAAR